MNDLSNSKYEELMALLEQEEEELNHLKDQELWLEKELKDQVDRNGEMYTEVQALRTQKKESEEYSQKLKGELRMSREENQKLIERIDSCRMENRELKDQAEKERRRSVSTCSLLRKDISERESDIARIKGVLMAALLYGILVTLFQIIKDDSMITELKEAGMTSWTILQYGIRSLLKIGEKAAIQSRMQTTGYLQGICYYLTLIVVTLFIGTVVVLPIIWLVRRMILFYQRKMINFPILLTTAVSLAVIVWFGSMIQGLITISRLEMFVQVQIALALGRGIPGSIERSRSCFS